MTTDELLAKGYAEECSSCGGISAYAHEDVTLDPNLVRFKSTKEQLKLIAHIPSCSGFEWQCGHCFTSWAERDSPIMAEAYTHIPPEELE